MKTYGRVLSEIYMHPGLSKKKVALTCCKSPNGKWKYSAILWFGRPEEAEKCDRWLRSKGWIVRAEIGWISFRMPLSPRGMTPPHFRGRML